MAANSLYDTIWDETFWFPANRTHKWEDLVNKPGSSTYYPDVNHLNWALVLAVILIGFRYIIEIVIVVPIAQWLGVPNENVRTVTPNAHLEKAYKDKNTRDYKIIKMLSKQTDLTERQIEIWFRKRKRMDSGTPMKKFCECSWLCLCYTTLFIYGINYLWHKDYFWKTIECWRDWPTQHVTNDMYWHYMLGLGFYWGLVFTMCSDTKRKDFKEMIIHHFVTIVLMYYSWVANIVRAGSLVLVVHDAADTWLALAKMSGYMKNKLATDIFFVIFLIVWVATRLIVYPFVILYCSMVEPYTSKLMDSPFGTYTFLNFFLLILLVLHIIWSYMIGKILYKKIVNGNVEDVRSDTEEELDDDGDNNIKEELSEDGRISNGTQSTSTNGI